MNAPALRGADPRPDSCADRFRTAQVVLLGTGGELLQQGGIHAHRHHFAGALTDRTAASLAQLLDWITTLSLVGPRLDHPVSDWHAVDLLITHIQIVLRN